MRRLTPLLILALALGLILALAFSGSGNDTPTYDPILDAERLHTLDTRRADDAAIAPARQMAGVLWQLIPPLLVAGVVGGLAYTVIADRAERRRRYAPDVNGMYEIPDWRSVKAELGDHIAANVVLAITGGQQQASIARQSAPALAVRASTPEPIVAPALPALEASEALPTAPTWSALMAQGFTPSTQKMLLGYGAAGPVYGGIDALLSTAIAGRPGQGKTTALRFIYAQTIMAGGQVVVLDPHGSIVDAIGDGMALWTASTHAELETGAEWLQGELGRRGESWRQGQRSFTPLLVLADEWPVISMQSKAAVDAAGRVILEARKWGCYALVSGQGLPAGKFGGSLVRDALSSRLIFKTTPAQARMAGLDTETARLVDQLDIGRCILDGPTNPQIVAIPNTTALDLSTLSRTGASSPAEQAALNSEFGPDSASESLRTELNQNSDNDQSTLNVETLIPRLKAQGLGKNAIIGIIWGARPGGSRAYQQASKLYDTFAS